MSDETAATLQGSPLSLAEVTATPEREYRNPRDGEDILR